MVADDGGSHVLLNSIIWFSRLVTICIVSKLVHIREENALFQY